MQPILLVHEVKTEKNLPNNLSKYVLFILIIKHFSHKSPQIRLHEILDNDVVASPHEWSDSLIDTVLFIWIHLIESSK